MDLVCNCNEHNLIWFDNTVWKFTYSIEVIDDPDFVVVILQVIQDVVAFHVRADIFLHALSVFVLELVRVHGVLQHSVSKDLSLHCEVTLKVIFKTYDCCVWRSGGLGNPAPGRGTGYCNRAISFFLSFFLCLFIPVSNITRKRLDRFAWNFQGRCGVTKGRPDSIQTDRRVEGQVVCYHRP